MLAHSHIVSRIVFDLELGAPAKARPLQDRISHFCRDRLAAVLDACLSEFYSDDTVFTFSNVELNLGGLSEEALEAQLSERIGQELKSVLLRRIPPPRATQAPLAARTGAIGPVRNDTGQMALLAAFLQNGRVPPAAGGEPEQWLAMLLENAPRDVLQLIRAMGSKQLVRQRLAHRFSEALVERVVRLLANGQADLMIRYAADIRETHRRKPIVPENRDVFGKTIWEFILTFLLLDRGSYFNTRAFIESTLRQLANRYRIDYRVLLAQLIAGVDSSQIPYSARYALPAVLLELHQGALADAAARPRVGPEAPGPQRDAVIARSLAQRRLHELAVFLDTGTLPWLQARSTGAGIDAIVGALIEDTPDALCELIRRSGVRRTVRIRMANQFSEALIRRLLRLLQPEAAGSMISYVGAVRRMHARKPIVSQDAPSFGRALWFFTLSYLLLERGSHFNDRAFIKDLLQNMAADYAIEYRDLLTTLAAQAPAQRFPLSGQHTLAALLGSLCDEVLVGLTPPRHVPHAASRSTDEVQALDRHAALDVLAYWLIWGVLPAWGEVKKVLTVDRLLRDLAQRMPHPLAELLTGLARHPALPKRLASQLDDGARESLLAVLAPQQGGVIRDCLDIFQLAYRARPLPGTDAAAFRSVLWEAVFCFLLPRTQLFDIAAFTRYVGEQLARHYQLSALAVAYFASLGIKRRRTVSTLSQALRDAFAGMASTPAALASPPAAAAPQSPVEALERFFIHGIWPLAAGAGADSGSADAALARWITQVPDSVLAQALRRCGSKQQAVARMVRRLPTDFMARTVRILAGGQGGLALAWLASLRAAASRLGFGGEAASPFQDRVATYLLAYLLRAAGRTWAIEQMMQEMLQALALHYGLSYRAMLETLCLHGVPAGTLAATCETLRDDAARRQRSGQEMRLHGTAARDAAEEALALSLHVLQHGTIPDWARHGEQRALRRILEEGVLLPRADLLVPALQASAERPAAILRLTEQLTPAQLLRLIEALAPSYAGFIHTYLLAGAALSLDGTLSGAQRRRAQALHWQVVLGLLLNRQGALLSPARFLSDAGEQVTQRLGLAPAAYFSRLHGIACAQQAAAPRYLPLAHMLEANLAASPQLLNGTKPAVRPLAQSSESAAAIAQGGTGNAWDRQDNPLMSLRYFMQYGVMPEPHAALPGSAPVAALIAHGLHHRAAALRRVLLWTAGRDLPRMRLARLLAPDLLRRVLQLLLAQDGADAALCVEALPPALASLTTRRGLTQSAVEGLLQSIDRQRGRRFELVSYVRIALQRSADQYELDVFSLSTALRAEILRRPRHENALRALQRAMCELEFESLPAQAGKQSWPQPGRTAAVVEQLPAGEAFYVGNAGLVLVWPFLQRYFQMLGLVQGGAFVGFAQQCRAAHLLQYLASGSIEAPEHALLLNKILCGINTALPLEVAGALSENEKQVSEQLLYGVTQNWEKLKNTSLDGLRETFLKREGRLLRKEDNWTLTVAGQSFDVLLKTLPWSFSTIRLSWMESVLWVQWK